MAEDVVGAGDRWIPDAEYQQIIARVPILCVDLLPVAGGAHEQVGLIRRQTFGGNEGWCLIGGAVLRNEPLRDAVQRHVKATLGPDVSADARSLELLGVFEYFTQPGIGELVDPRKHAVSVTYCGALSGKERPQGEALEFTWFGRDMLGSLTYGFGQERVVEQFTRGVW